MGGMDGLGGLYGMGSIGPMGMDGMGGPMGGVGGMVQAHIHLVGFLLILVKGISFFSSESHYHKGPLPSGCIALVETSPIMRHSKLANSMFACFGLKKSGFFGKVQRFCSCVPKTLVQ